MMLSLFQTSQRQSAVPWQRLLKSFTAFIRKISIDNHLQAYKERAFKNYKKGEFYAKALLPQFQINSREEAFQLIQEQGHLLSTDAFIHGDACLPNFILKMLAISLALLILVWLISVIGISISFGQFGPSTITYMTLNTLNYFLTIMGENRSIYIKLRLVAAFEAFWIKGKI